MSSPDNGVDEFITFDGGSIVGDFELFGGQSSESLVSADVWLTSKSSMIDSGLHQQSPLILGADLDASFTDPNDSLLGEFIELSEQSNPCARPAF